MFGLLQKNVAGTLRHVTQPGHGFLPGQFLQIIGGPLPGELEQLSEPVSVDAVVPNDRIRLVDVQRFLEDTSPRPKPAAVQIEWLDTSQVRTRFGWSERQFEDAKLLGLPPSRSAIYDPPGSDADPVLHYLRRRDHLDAWVARLQRIAATTAV